MNQQSLFDEPSYQPTGAVAGRPLAARSAPIDDQTRLTGQNEVIYRLLAEAPRTNQELAAISLKYTSRVSDIRKWLKASGGSITCSRIGGGLTLYTMFEQENPGG